MAARKKSSKAAKAGKSFHVDLNAANWKDFSGATELQDFLDSHVSGVVKQNSKQAGWRSVALQISTAPRGGKSATSKTEIAYISICPTPPCPGW